MSLCHSTASPRQEIWSAPSIQTRESVTWVHTLSVLRMPIVFNLSTQIQYTRSATCRTTERESNMVKPSKKTHTQDVKKYQNNKRKQIKHKHKQPHKPTHTRAHTHKWQLKRQLMTYPLCTEAFGLSRIVFTFDSVDFQIFCSHSN